MGKRGNGEGSITRRKDGLYMARYTVQTATGTKRKTIYGKEREEVAEKLVDALSNRNKGLVFDAGSQTVGEYVERWLQTSAKGSVGRVPTSRIANRWSATWSRLRAREAEEALRHANPGDVSGDARQGPLPAHRAVHPRVLHRALGQAVRWGLIPRNVSRTWTGRASVGKRYGPSTAPRPASSSRPPGESGDRFEALYVWPCTPGCGPASCSA
jgi:integrase